MVKVLEKKHSDTIEFTPFKGQEDYPSLKKNIEFIFHFLRNQKDILNVFFKAPALPSDTTIMTTDLFGKFKNSNKIIETDVNFQKTDTCPDSLKESILKNYFRGRNHIVRSVSLNEKVPFFRSLPCHSNIFGEIGDLNTDWVELFNNYYNNFSNPFLAQKYLYKILFLRDSPYFKFTKFIKFLWMENDLNENYLIGIYLDKDILNTVNKRFIMNFFIACRYPEDHPIGSLIFEKFSWKEFFILNQSFYEQDKIDFIKYPVKFPEYIWPGNHSFLNTTDSKNVYNFLKGKTDFKPFLSSKDEKVKNEVSFYTRMELYGNDARMWGASVPKDNPRLRRDALRIPENISNNYQKKTSVTFSSKFSSVSRKAYFNNEEELLKFYKEYLAYVEGEE